ADLKPDADDSTAETAPRNADDTQRLEAVRLGDAVAEELLCRMVRVQLAPGPKVKQNQTYRIKIINDSPMILAGLALGGVEADAGERPSILAGLSIPPLKNLTVPATAELVERLNLNHAQRVLAADLAGL